KGLGVDANTLKERFRAMLGWRELIRRRFSALVSVNQRDIDRAVSSEGGEESVELHLQKITLSLPTSSDQAHMAKRFAEAETLRRKFGGCKSMAGPAQEGGRGQNQAKKFVKPTRNSRPAPTPVAHPHD